MSDAREPIADENGLEAAGQRSSDVGYRLSVIGQMLLTAIVFLPLVGAVLVLLAGGRGDNPEREGAVRLLSLAVSLVTFAATLLLWWRFNPASADFQFVEQHQWLPQFGISYHLGVDGISLLLIVLTGFLTPL